MKGPIKMKLEGLTVNFLGDSITEGTGTTAPDRVFHQLIKEKYKLTHAYNYGIGGTRIARQTVPGKVSTKYDLTFEIRAEIMDRKADAVVVFGGTNDYGHGDAAFGERDSEDIYTFTGAVNSLIKKLQRDFPNAKIIFMTPLHRKGEGEIPSLASKFLSDYACAIKEICSGYGIPVIDLFGINPINPYDELLMPDGLHPSDLGHEVLAKVVGEALESL